MEGENRWSCPSLRGEGGPPEPVCLTTVHQPSRRGPARSPRWPPAARRGRSCPEAVTPGPSRLLPPPVPAPGPSRSSLHIPRRTRRPPHPTLLPLTPSRLRLPTRLSQGGAATSGCLTGFSLSLEDLTPLRTDAHLLPLPTARPAQPRLPGLDHLQEMLSPCHRGPLRLGPAPTSPGRRPLRTKQMVEGSGRTLGGGQGFPDEPQTQT